jgi:hypothetical protein
MVPGLVGDNWFRGHWSLPLFTHRNRRLVTRGTRRAELGDGENQWSDAVPMTMPLRTLKDVAQAGLDPDLVEQAIDEARDRGLVGDEVERRILRFLILHRTDGE